VGEIRGTLSVVLVVLAAISAVAGGVALYLRSEIVEPQSFANRSVDALDNDDVRSVVSREIVVQLIDQGSTDLVSARPVLESVTAFVIRSDAFKRVFRNAAIQGNRVMFAREGSDAVFDVSNAGTVVTETLRSVAPDVARRIPPDTDATLLEMRRRSFATQTLRVADDVRFLGIVLPLLALVLAAGAIAVAPDRRGAITRLGIALGTGAALLVIALIVIEAYIGAHIYGSDELTDEDVRNAFHGLWDVYLGDLTTWAVGLGALSLVVAAASASLLRPFDAGATIERLTALARPPERSGWRVLHGLAVLAIGIFVVLEPTLAVSMIAVVAGALLAYYGTGEIISAVRLRGRRSEERARRNLVVSGAVGGAVVLAAIGAVVVLASSGGEDDARAGPVDTCNGYKQLCNRRLDEVVFAGTHNAMSSADSKGWLLANQRRTIQRQLRDGIRLFLIDPHYGVEDRTGKVRTDFGAERRNLNRVGKKLTPQALAAVERLGGTLGLGEFTGGRRELWLCHSVCELGATRMVDAMRTIRRFLQRNPGEVVMLLSEDYVRERDLDKVYRRSGLAPYLVTLDRLEPLPTLRQLVDENKRLIVFTERKPRGEFEWNNEGFSWIQDTPLGATKAKDFSCKLNRGDRNSPLFAINNWIDRFPPPLEANKAILKRKFIIERAKKCQRERGHLPNLIASDFYDQGDLVGAVRELNGLGDVPPAPTRP
jgi:hypothetical protein